MQKNTHPGKFIVFEGLDGSGQTTQANALAQLLKEKNKDATITKEPTATSDPGKKIRDVLDKREVILPQKLQELFAQDRAYHLQTEIIPALERGQWVISDRYAFSSFAFGASAGTDLRWLINLNSTFLLPDITFMLKVSPSVCVERIANRGEEQTLFEQEQKLRKVWEVYRTLPEKFPSIHVIDGEQAIEKVTQDIWQIISPQLD